MNAKNLADEAALSTSRWLAAVSDEVALRLELAYVAQWLANNDEEHLSSAARTAVQAISIIHNRPHRQ